MKYDTAHTSFFQTQEKQSLQLGTQAFTHLGSCKCTYHGHRGAVPTKRVYQLANTWRFHFIVAAQVQLMDMKIHMPLLGSI